MTNMEDCDNPVLSALPLSSNRQILHIEDYPKRWRREYIGSLEIPEEVIPPAGYFEALKEVKKRKEGRRWKAAELFEMRDPWRTRDLTYYEHQRRALAAREAYVEALADPDSENHRVLNADLWTRAQRIFHKKIFDPLDFVLPEFLTIQTPVIASPYAQCKRSTIPPVCTTHMENLYGMIVDSFLDTEKIIPPPPIGFGVPNKSGSRPGESMQLDGSNLKIGDAFQARRAMILHFDPDTEILSGLIDADKAREARKLYGDSIEWKQGDRLVGKIHPKDITLDPVGIEYAENLSLGPVW